MSERMNPPTSPSASQGSKGNRLTSVGKMSSKKSPMKRSPSKLEDSQEGMQTTMDRGDPPENGSSSNDEGKNNSVETDPDSNPQQVENDSFIPLWAEVDDDVETRPLVSTKTPQVASDSKVTTRGESADEKDQVIETTSSEDEVEDASPTEVDQDESQRNEAMMERVSQDIQRIEADSIGRVNYYKSVQEKPDSNDISTSSTSQSWRQTIINPPKLNQLPQPSSILQEMQASYSKLVSLPSVKRVMRICAKTVTYLGMMYLACLSIFVIIIPYLSDEEY